MTEIRNKTGGRPAKNRIDKQKRVVSTKLTELQYYITLSRSEPENPVCLLANTSGKRLFRQR